MNKKELTDEEKQNYWQIDLQLLLRGRLSDIEN